MIDTKSDEEHEHYTQNLALCFPVTVQGAQTLREGSQLVVGFGRSVRMVLTQQMSFDND